MKTLLIFIAGIADTPDPLSLKETPLNVASIPSLDMLARRGFMTSFFTVAEPFDISHKNALLSVLGYDLEKGEPSIEGLMEFGLDSSASCADYPGMRPFVIPGFSGHGVCITTSAWVRGLAKMALLKPLDIYSPGSSDAEILETEAKLATEWIQKSEFVFLYVDLPLKASLRGDYDAKVKALETIDRHLITPIADFVWKSDLLINLAVTTDLVTPWHRRRPAKVGVPAIFYYNNNDSEGNPDMGFSEVQAMLAGHSLKSPIDLIRYLSEFNP